MLHATPDPVSALVLADPFVSSKVLAVTLEILAESVDSYTADSRAKSTRRAYAGEFKRFEVWCRAHGAPSLPTTPTAVAMYLAHLANSGKRPSTIGVALAGIADAHRNADVPWEKGSKAIVDVVSGIRRRLGVACTQKAPTLDTDLGAMVASLGTDLGDIRDRAMLTLGWMGAFRRSELVALDVSDLEEVHEGLIVHVRKSKTDQTGEGRIKAIPFASDARVCPVRSLRAWLAAASIVEGPVFRAVNKSGKVGKRLHPAAVARAVKVTAKAAGLDPSKYAGHSLRAGFVTVCTKRGRPIDAIMRQGFWVNPATLAKYVRLANAFEQSAAVGLL